MVLTSSYKKQKKPQKSTKQLSQETAKREKTALTGKGSNVVVSQSDSAWKKAHGVQRPLHFVKAAKSLRTYTNIPSIINIVTPRYYSYCCMDGVNRAMNALDNTNQSTISSPKNSTKCGTAVPMQAFSLFRVCGTDLESHKLFFEIPQVRQQSTTAIPPAPADLYAAALRCAATTRQPMLPMMRHMRRSARSKRYLTLIRVQQSHVVVTVRLPKPSGWSGEKAKATSSLRRITLRGII